MPRYRIRTNETVWSETFEIPNGHGWLIEMLQRMGYQLLPHNLDNMTVKDAVIAGALLPYEVADMQKAKEAGLYDPPVPDNAIERKNMAAFIGAMRDLIGEKWTVVCDTLDEANKLTQLYYGRDWAPYTQLYGVPVEVRSKVTRIVSDDIGAKVLAECSSRNADEAYQRLKDAGYYICRMDRPAPTPAPAATVTVAGDFNRYQKRSTSPAIESDWVNCTKEEYYTIYRTGNLEGVPCDCRILAGGGGSASGGGTGGGSASFVSKPPQNAGGGGGNMSRAYLKRPSTPRGGDWMDCTKVEYDTIKAFGTLNGRPFEAVII